MKWTRASLHDVRAAATCARYRMRENAQSKITFYVPRAKIITACAEPRGLQRKSRLDSRPAFTGRYYVPLRA